MAKAKTPVSTDGKAKDTSEAGAAKPTGSVPKTTRSKSSTAKASGTAKTAKTAAAKTAGAAKASTPTKKPDSKPADAAPTKEAAKPEKTEVAGKESVKPVEAKTTPPPQSKPITQTTQQPEKNGSIFWPLLIGGALAAALGFLASEMNLLGTRSDTSDLRASLSAQQEQITELMNAEPPEAAPVEFPELDGLTSQLEELSASISALDMRLIDVEKRPIASGSSEAPTIDTSAYEREVEALRASVAEQRAEIQGLLDNALSVEEATAQAARTAALQAALARITAAINNGKPFGSALTELEKGGMDDTPAVLSDVADSGVVTLINLQSRFPDTARSALSAARAVGSDDAEGGVGGFLRRQLGARSVAPREGTDPDAVLSRAEAAVRDGRLTDALAELDTLPVPSQEAMQDWIADARARQAAEAAAEDLSHRLTAN